MPQQYQEQVRNRDFKTTSQQSAQLQTMASPVNTYVQPGKDPLLGLADALSGLNPALKAYQDNRDAGLMDEGRAMYLKGEALKGDEPDKKVKGYRSLQWGEKARNANVAINEEIDRVKDDPEWMAANAENPQGGIQNIIKARIAADLQGEQDPDMIKEYSNRMLPLLDQLPIKFAEYQRGVVDKETDDIMGRRNMDILSYEGTAEEQRAMYDRDAPTFAALGKSKIEREASFVDALIAHATETMNPALFNMADIKDADGHAMSDNPDLKEKILKAKAHVVKLDHDDHLKKTEPHRQEWWGTIEQALESDPFSPLLTAENLAKEVHEYGALSGERDFGTLWGRVLNAQKAKLKEDGAKYFMPPPSQWALKAKDPDFIKFYKESDFAIVDAIDWQNPASVRGALQLLKQRQADSTLPSPSLQGLLGAFASAAVDPDTNQVPPALMFAYQTYKYFEKEAPGALRSMMDEDSLLVADRISREMNSHSVSPITLAEAVLKIQKSRAEGGKKNVEAVQKDGKLTKAVEKAINDKFSSSWFGLAGSDNFDNRALTTEARQRVTELIVSHGYKDQEAIDRAVLELDNKYVSDGHNSYIEVPLGMDKVAIEEGARKYLDEYAKLNGAGERFLRLNADGKSYTMTDALSGMPINDNIKPASLLGIDRPITYADPKKQAMLIDVSTKLLGGLRDGTLSNMGDYIDANYGAVNELLKGETFSMWQKIRLKGFIEKRDAEMAFKSREAFQTIINNNKSFLSPFSAPIYGDPTKPLSSSMEPTRYAGTLTNVSEIAAHYYNKSPLGAMIMDAEGLRLNPYKDSDGGLAIGFGYNLGQHSAKENRDMLRKAGVASDVINDIVAGRRPKGVNNALTTEQAIKLLEFTVTPYREQAERVYGTGWSMLPETARAVLVDMAYNTGNVGQFRKVIQAMKDGNLTEASKNLTLKYTDKATGKKVDNIRRVQIWREMLSGQYGTILSKKAERTKRK